MNTRWRTESVGRVKCLRYQPTPDGRKPPEPRVELVLSNGPSMLQSCGTSSLRHAESLNEGFSAPETSPLKKSQPASNESVVREVGRTLEGENESAIVPTKQRVISFSIVVLFRVNEFRREW